MKRKLSGIHFFVVTIVLAAAYLYLWLSGNWVERPLAVALLRQPPENIAIKSPLWDLRTEYPIDWKSKANGSGTIDYSWSGVMNLNQESPGIVIRSGSTELTQLPTLSDLRKTNDSFYFDMGPLPIPIAKQVRFKSEEPHPFDVTVPSASTWIRFEGKRLLRDAKKLTVEFSLGGSWEQSVPIQSSDWRPLVAGPFNTRGGPQILKIRVLGVSPGLRDVYLRDLSFIQSSSIQVSLPADCLPPRVLIRPLYPTQSYLAGEGAVSSQTNNHWIENPWKTYDEDSRWVYPLEIRRLVRTSVFLPSPSEFRIKVNAEKESILQFYPGVQNPLKPEESYAGNLCVHHQHDGDRKKIWEGRIEGSPLGNERIHDQYLQPWQVQKTRGELDQTLWREGVRILLPDMQEGDHYLIFESIGEDKALNPSPIYIGEPTLLPPSRLDDLGIFITEEEILDWNSLLEKLLQSEKKNSGTPVRRIWLSMDWESRVLLGRVDVPGEITDSTKEILLESLNQVLKDPKFYSKDYFKTTVFPEEMYDLLASIDESSTAEQFARLNRIVFESIFPDEILPRMQFVPVPKKCPNIILISLDTLRGDSLSCLGYPRGTTPWMREFFERDGVRFKNANSTATWTLPSHVSLFLSQYVSRHGILQDIQSLPAHADTLAEFLSRRGYETAAFVDRGFLHHHYGFYQGFQGYQEKGGGFQNILPDCVEFLEHRDRTSPLFLFLHTFDIHDPYIPPHPFRDRFLLETMAPSRVDFLIPNFDVVRASNMGVVELTRDDKDYAKALYDAQIVFVDLKLREFFSKLKKNRLLDNSIVILLSDHGEAFGEHGFWGHGWTVFEEVTHVPLLMRFPEEEFAGVEIDERVNLVDIAPTIADCLGFEIPEQWQGESLMPLINHPESKLERKTYSQHSGNFAMYQGFLKLIEQRNLYPSPLNEKNMPANAVFDLETDPYEEENLISDPPIPATEEFQRLREAMNIMAQQREAEGEIGHVDLDSEQIQELQALGYLK